VFFSQHAVIFPGVRAAAFLSLLLVSATWAPARLSPLAPSPDWSKLDAFQKTVTREDFEALLKIYAPGGAWKDTILIKDDVAIITTRPDRAPYLLRFAPSRQAAKAVPTYWRTRANLPAEEPGKPLSGLKIALDPGHLGGYWAKVEERWFQIGNSKPVTEGDMTLFVAKLLAKRLQSYGAQVYLTRTRPGPVTSLRPDRLKKAAEASLQDKSEVINETSLQKESERLFYRVGEIRRRGTLVNEKIQPDAVICLHFNAEAWGDPTNPQLVDRNHLHFLITGALSAQELTYEDQRFDMLMKMLNRSYSTELALTGAIAGKMAAATGLPPYRYESNAAIRVNSNPYIWARNLLANRLFHCPVVYVEPYVMNSRSAFARIQAGDYEGTRNFGGTMRRSIFREYADAVADGILAYYSNRPL
jgi:N-acetylmuramoyl-L-alanine amidase